MIPEPMMELMKFILAPAMELVYFFSPVSVTSSSPFPSPSPCKDNEMKRTCTYSWSHMIVT